MNRLARRSTDERGFALLFVFVLAAGIGIGLLMQLPRVAFETQRNREEMLIERGEQYQRAIGLYLKTVKRYPAKIEDLENTNNIRFLRRRYIDPMTGKDDWRLVHVGPGGQLTDSLVQKPPAQTKDGKPEDPMNVDPSNTVGANQGPTEVNAAVKARPSDMVGGVPVGAPPPPGQPGAQQYGQANPIAVQPGYAQPGQPGQPAAPGAFQQPLPGQPGYSQQAQPGAPGIYPQAVQAWYPPGQARPGQRIMLDPRGIPIVQGQAIQPGQPGGAQLQPGQVMYPPGYPQPGQAAAGQTQPSHMVYPPRYTQPGQPEAGQTQPGQVMYPPGYPQPGQPSALPGQPGQVVYPSGYPQPGMVQPGQPPQPGQTPYNPMQPPPGAPQGQVNTPGLPQYLQPQSTQNRPNQQQAGTPGSPQQQMTAQQLIQGILTGGRNTAPSAFNNQNSYGGGIAGVASKYEGPSIKIYSDRQKYQEWEFVYDPKKDTALMQGMPAAANPNAGGKPASQSDRGFGSSNSSSFGSSNSSSFGSSNSSSFGSGGSPAPPPGRNR